MRIKKPEVIKEEGEAFIFFWIAKSYFYIEYSSVFLPLGSVKRLLFNHAGLQLRLLNWQHA